MIRMPRLLDENLMEKARLSVVRLSLHRKLRELSTAELILADDAPEVALRDLVELYDQNGSAGIYRVQRVSADLGRTRALTLEHALCTLRDGIIPAQGFTGTVREAMERLLDCQSSPRWAVGDVDAPEDVLVVFAAAYTNLLEALTHLMDMLPEGYALDYDQSVTPWLLHLRRLSDTDLCEGRLTRNLQSIRQDLDSSRLCTRVYPFGRENDTGRISLMPLNGSDHLDSPAASTLGVISRTFEHDQIIDAPTLNAVALSYLERHAVPETVLTVHAADLSHATRLPLDAFRVGKLCRLCLPDLDCTLAERIIAIDEPDVFGAPGQTVLTLSNHLKIQTEKEELDELVRQATASRLIGGTVTEVVEQHYGQGTTDAPIYHYFDVEDWAAVLDVQITLNPNSGVYIRSLILDGQYPAGSLWTNGSLSALPFLRRDELGQIARGRHSLVIYPSNGNAGETCGVSSTVTMTVIKKETT